MPDIKVGTTLWRNQDQRFEKQLQGKSAERKIGVEMLFSATPDGFALRLTDEEGLSVTHSIVAEQQEARNNSSNQAIRQSSNLLPHGRPSSHLRQGRL
jgi:putative protease